MVLTKEFYKVQELADILQVTRMTIYRLQQAGKIKAHSIGRVMRFRKEDIEAYLKKAKK